MTILKDCGDFESMTPTRHIDRRTERLPTAQELAALDSERQIKRAEIKRQISAATLAEKRRLEIVAAIEEINLRKEQLAAEHVETCAPLQVELASIEQGQITAITNRESVDETVEDRRKELLGELASRNTDLEEKIAHEDRLLAALEIDRVAAAKACGTSILQNELVQLARPELRLKMRSTAAIAERLEHWRDSLRKDCVSYPREVGRLRAELEIVEAMFAKSEVDANEAYQDCLHE